MRTRYFGLLAVATLVLGCGPRLSKKPGEAESPTANLGDIPLATMAVQVDPAKLDANKKLAADGEFKVAGLFYKDKEPVEATVKVTLHPKDNVVMRSYVVDLNSVRGAGAKVEMSDGGTLTVVVPDEESAVPGFETSNPNIQAMGVELPGGTEPSTCYLGKDLLETSIKFALCDLGGNGKPPVLRFIDAPSEAAAAPATGEAPATGAAPAEAAPAASAAPAAK
jgi:hypothetical protein